MEWHYDVTMDTIMSEVIIAKRKSPSGSFALFCRDMDLGLSVLRWTVQQSFISHTTIFGHFACASTDPTFKHHTKQNSPIYHVFVPQLIIIQFLER